MVDAGMQIDLAFEQKEFVLGAGFADIDLFGEMNTILTA